jgi:hypothetical protein
MATSDPNNAAEGRFNQTLVVIKRSISCASTINAIMLFTFTYGVHIISSISHTGGVRVLMFMGVIQ